MNTVSRYVSLARIDLVGLAQYLDQAHGIYPSPTLLVRPTADCGDKSAAYPHL